MYVLVGGWVCIIDVAGEREGGGGREREMERGGWEGKEEEGERAMHVESKIDLLFGRENHFVNITTIYGSKYSLYCRLTISSVLMIMLTLKASNHVRYLMISTQ